jgi:predicted nucleic acid-binding protein
MEVTFSPGNGLSDLTIKVTRKRVIELNRQRAMGFERPTATERERRRFVGAGYVEPTDVDAARLAAAEAKRQRKAAKRIGAV